MNKNISKLIKEIQQDNEFSFSDFLAFLSNENNYMDLWPLASEKTKSKGHKFFSCGIISAKSGACTENCTFCAQSSQHKTAIKKYDFIKLDKILERAEALTQAGASYMGIVCSGGSLKNADLDYLCKTAEEIKKRLPINLCASIGAINTAQAISIKKAGFSKYHHNLETSEKFFPKICTTHTFKSRQDNIKAAQKAQLEICSGGIFGLGESWQDRWDLAMELKKLQVKSVPINFLMPIKTPGWKNKKFLEN